MTKLIFASGNSDKFNIGTSVLSPFDVELTQLDLDIDEIQAEDGEKVVRDKLSKAYEITKSPVLVSDDSWEIEGLKGFPGPYLKSINYWLTVDDLLRLTRDLDNRTVYLIQYLAYTDGKTTKVFKQQTKGELLKEPRGVQNIASQQIMSLEGSNGKSIAEVFDSDPTFSNDNVSKVWRDFANWFKSNS
jgi:XTP/dITP diphosphohydrolase